MKTILITGINGFLGSNLAKRFSKNYNIIGTEISLENLFRIKDNNFLVYLSDEESIRKIFTDNKIDIIIHTATFYGRNDEEIVQLAESNLFAPFYLLNYAINNKVELFLNTDTALEKFTSAYALTKKQFRDWLDFRSSEITVVNIQLEHFYGPGASSTNFINAMIAKLLKNEPQIDLTLGEQKRDFIYYEDILNAYDLIINRKEKLQNGFNHFEVGSGELISIKELMILLKVLTDSISILNFGSLPYRANELMESSADTKNIMELGWKPKIKIKEGLLNIIKETNK